MTNIPQTLDTHASTIYGLLTAVIVTGAFLVACVMALGSQNETRIEHFLTLSVAGVAAIRALYTGHVATKIQTVTNGLSETSRNVARAEGLAEGSQAVTAAMAAGYKAGMIGTHPEALGGTDEILRELRAQGKVTDQVHGLVNNAMAVQLQTNAILARKLADLTHTEEDKASAVSAEAAYTEHMRKQGIVDGAAEVK